MEIGGTSSEQMDNGKHVSLDIDKLAESVEGKLNFLHPFSAECSIYRVPRRLRELNEKAYTPQVISIGPFHHGKEELKEMEEHKRLYLMEFLELSKVSVKDYILAIAEQETRLRNCYAETFENLSTEEFMEMMILDCSFVIMFLLKRIFSDVRSRNVDRIFNKPWMRNEIRYDLFLLENQLPFFILEELLNLSKIQHRREEYSMMKLAHAFLHAVWDMLVPDNILEQINSSKVDHFVDFLIIYQQPALQKMPKETTTLTIPSVMELHGAGIKFKLGINKNQLDIKFDDIKRTLKISQLKIGDKTEMLFRNLQVFDQCNHDINKFINEYIIML